MAYHGNFRGVQGAQDVGQYVIPVKKPKFSNTINWTPCFKGCISTLVGLGCTALLISIIYISIEKGVGQPVNRQTSVLTTFFQVSFGICALCFLAPAIVCCVMCYRYEKQMRCYRRYQAGTLNEDPMPTIVHPVAVPASIRGSATALPVPDTSFGMQMNVYPTAPENSAFAMGRYSGPVNDQLPENPAFAMGRYSRPVNDQLPENPAFAMGRYTDPANDQPPPYEEVVKQPPY